MSCKENEQLLVNYVLGELSESEKQDLERHLFSCAACRREVDALRSVTEHIAEALDDQPLETKLDDAHRSAILLASGMRLLMWGRLATFGSIAALFIMGFWGIWGQLNSTKEQFSPNRIMIVKSEADVAEYAISNENDEDYEEETVATAEVTLERAVNEAADMLALAEEPRPQSVEAYDFSVADERSMPIPECAPAERTFALSKGSSKAMKTQDAGMGIAVCNTLEEDCLPVGGARRIVKGKSRDVMQSPIFKDILVHKICPIVRDQVVQYDWLETYGAHEVRLWQIGQGEWIILYYPWNLQREEIWEGK